MKKKSDPMIIYNLFPLLAGPFSQWHRHFDRAAALGFTWVFVNPVQRPGASGSLYSIADYFDFNPLLADPAATGGSAEQFRAAVAAAAARGLQVMVDLVINHCAADSPLVAEHPEWFLREPDGRVVHPSCTENGRTVVWKDLAKFNHRTSADREGLYACCLAIIDFLVELGCRGFRCDAAYQVPSSVWKRLIRDARRKHPGIRFFAETLGCPPDQTRHTAEAGFDYIFNSSKWWDFQAPWLMAQYHLTRDIAPSVSFPESHDTPRLCEELQGNVAGLKQRYLFAALFASGVMMPVGYEFGFRTRLHVVTTRPTDWEETGIDLSDYIARVNRLKARHPVLQEEAPAHVLNHLNPGIVLMWKGSLNSREECLMIINRDIYNPQPFFAPRLHDFIQAGTEMTDVSPEYALDYIPQPFAYDLRPGQILVFIANREPVQDA